ncbi:MAG: hypothetical protein AAF772_21090, partial [Acidobacteriota bacterium]
ADDDDIVRAAAFGWLAVQPVIDDETLLAAARGRWLIDDERALVDALRARALAEPLERGAIAAKLE